VSAKRDRISEFLDQWRTEHPGESFAPELERESSNFAAELRSTALNEIRSWLVECQSKKIALEKEFPHLKRVYSPLSERREDLEYNLCELLIPHLRLEIARRGRQREATRTHSNAMEKPVDKRDESASAPRDFQHSDDYRSVVFKGETHTLTSNQAQVVEILHNAYCSGIPDLGKDHVLEKLGTPASRLRDTFRKSKLWGTLIVFGAKRGTYRLNLSG
jgi:hypothetical protein